MAHERAEEVEADGQGPDGGDHPARSLRRHGLTKSRAGAVHGLSHLSPGGAARMVDVSEKRETAREAVARAVLKMAPATLRVIRRGNAPKGDVLGVARTAGILAAKRTPQLIPLCHPLRITGVDVTFSDDLRRSEEHTSELQSHSDLVCR